MLSEKETRRKLKEFKKDIKLLKKEYRKLEFRPCQNDAELHAKEDELNDIMDRIYKLENKQDRFMLDSLRASQMKQ